MSELRSELIPSDELSSRVVAEINRHGLSVIYVPSTNDQPPWAYSVGLYKKFDSPEVIVFGLGLELSHYMVCELGRRAQSAPLEAGQVHERLIKDHVCVLKPVQRNWYRYFVDVAVWYYSEVQFPLLQCIWPDRNGRVPWDPTYRLYREQPLLFHEHASTARADMLVRSIEQPGAAGIVCPEHVHHVDGDKQNNCLENLVGLSASDHAAAHRSFFPALARSLMDNGVVRFNREVGAYELTAGDEIVRPTHSEGVSGSSSGKRRHYRAVAEEMLCRPLRKGECVHHINGDKSDASPANLHVYSSHKAHMRGHATFAVLLTQLMAGGFVEYDYENNLYKLGPRIGSTGNKPRVEDSRRGPFSRAPEVDADN